MTNLAYQQTAASSSVEGGRVASFGTDGDPNENFYTQNNAQPWWGVDLGQVYPVDTVGINNYYVPSRQSQYHCIFTLIFLHTN